MRNILTIALVDLRLYVTDRSNLALGVLMPIIFTLILGSAIPTGDDAPSYLRVDVQDLDNSPQSAQLLADLRAENPLYILCPMDDALNDQPAHTCFFGDENFATTVEESTTRVTEGRTSALLIIPEGYGESAENFEPVDLAYYSLADITTGDAVRQSIDAVLMRLNNAAVTAQVAVGVADALTGSGIDDSIYPDDAARDALMLDAAANAIAAWENETVQVQYVLTQEGEQDPNAVQSSGFSQSVPGMASMFVLFTVLGGMSLLLEERRQWTLQRIAVMPVTRAQILAGKILARFTTGVLQFVILFTVGLFVGLDFGNDIFALAVIVVAYTLCITALAFAVAPMIKTPAQAGALVMLFSLVFASLGGAWWPLDIVPEIMQIIGHISPVAWAMDGFTTLLFYGGGLVDVLVPVGVLLALTAGLFAFGITRFTYE
jgi:ABC-type multidrug transport system permease subunit